MSTSNHSGLNTGDIYRDGAFAKTPGFSYKKDDTVIAVKTHHPFWDDNNGPDPSAPKGRYWERYEYMLLLSNSTPDVRQR